MKWNADIQYTVKWSTGIQAYFRKHTKKYSFGERDKNAHKRDWREVAQYFSDLIGQWAALIFDLSESPCRYMWTGQIITRTSITVPSHTHTHSKTHTHTLL